MGGSFPGGWGPLITLAMAEFWGFVNFLKRFIYNAAMPIDMAIVAVNAVAWIPVVATAVTTAATITGVYATYLGVKKSRSGNVKDTQADILWDKQEWMVDLFREELTQTRERMAVVEDENGKLRTQVRDLEKEDHRKQLLIEQQAAKMTTLETKIAELEARQ